MDSGKKIIARLHSADFGMSDSNFNSLNILKDNKIYYTLCSHNIDTHGRIYKYDPAGDGIELFTDLGAVTGETGKKSLPQGKSHTPIIEADGKIYFATHYGFYQGNEGKEEPAPPPQGYSPYPGGKIIEYDKASGKFSILAVAPPEEGILTMNMDTKRMIIYCLTWPKGIFMYYDINKKKLKTIGQDFTIRICKIDGPVSRINGKRTAKAKIIFSNPDLAATGHRTNYFQLLFIYIIIHKNALRPGQAIDNPSPGVNIHS